MVVDDQIAGVKGHGRLVLPFYDEIFDSKRLFLPLGEEELLYFWKLVYHSVYISLEG